ncbi:MAG TPA: DUF3800 domain-containing protein [Rhizomicrobium sp.]|jgi:hypothetical protein
MLPRGGWAIVIEVQCGFDESGTHAGSPFLCVAGYVIDQAQMAAFDDDWNATLAWSELPHRLEYFRMSECAPDPGNGPFRGLSKGQRIQVASRMIGTIKRHTYAGIAVSINEQEFHEAMPPHPLIGTPYTFCAHVLLAGISNLIDARPEIERAAYIFEAGHASAPEANAIMTLLFKSPDAAQRHRYNGHAFVPKVGNPIVQAADLLAWQCYTAKKRELAGHPPRRDFVSLTQHPHRHVHIGTAKIAELADAFANALPDADTFRRLYLGDR